MASSCVYASRSLHCEPFSAAQITTMEPTEDPSSKAPTGTESTPAFEGSCACGRIQYTCSQTPQSMTNCHCRTCRKLAGAPYLTWASVQTDSVEWRAGPPDVWKGSPIAERGHCSRCGSTMTMRYHHQPEELGIASGTIGKSAAPLPRPKEHIFLQDKAVWFELPDDGLQRFDEFDPPFQHELDEWKRTQT